jgi:hypothetical protein
MTGPDRKLTDEWLRRIAAMPPLQRVEALTDKALPSAFRAAWIKFSEEHERTEIERGRLEE